MGPVASPKAIVSCVDVPKLNTLEGSDALEWLGIGSTPLLVFKNLEANSVKLFIKKRRMEGIHTTFNYEEVVFKVVDNNRWGNWRLGYGEVHPRP